MIWVYSQLKLFCKFNRRLTSLRLKRLSLTLPSDVSTFRLFSSLWWRKLCANLVQVRIVSHDHLRRTPYPTWRNVIGLREQINKRISLKTLTGMLLLLPLLLVAFPLPSDIVAWSDAVPALINESTASCSSDGSFMSPRDDDWWLLLSDTLSTSSRHRPFFPKSFGISSQLSTQPYLFIKNYFAN